jgi:hypothetical protein
MTPFADCIASDRLIVGPSLATTTKKNILTLDHSDNTNGNAVQQYTATLFYMSMTYSQLVLDHGGLGGTQTHVQPQWT